MSYLKRIVCLANSRKFGGRCIAGKDVGPRFVGAWVRPVSSGDTTELAREERRYADGKDPKVLDVLDVGLLEPAPHGYQTENHRLDIAHGYRFVGTWPWARMPELLDHPPGLWTNGSSSRHGVNDRVAADEAAKLNSSLLLIEPEAVTMRVFTEGGKPRVRARFRYAGVPFVFSVTDPFAEWAWLKKPDGEYELPGVLLCISLGEPFTDGYCYKLVATVLTAPEFPKK